jgi:ABC-type nitrate/sulfonate/bicarbonate transport system permease component
VNPAASVRPRRTNPPGGLERIARLTRSRWAVFLASLAVVSVVWEVLGRQRPVFASYPSQILEAATRTLIPDVLPAFAETAVGFALGFAIAVVAGVAIGLAMARSRLLDLVLAPYMNALYATPRIALIPVMILWFGIDFELRVTIVVLSAIFPVIINTYAGARAVDSEHIDIGRAFMADRWQLLLSVVIPASLPFIYAGIRIGLARAMSGVIVAEMTASISGVGRLVIDYSKYLRTDSLFVALICLGLISLFLTAILTWIKRRTMPWAPEDGR